MLVGEHHGAFGEEPGTYPVVLLLSPQNGTRVAPDKAYYFFGDKQVAVNLRIQNNTNYNSFQMQTTFTEQGQVAKATLTFVAIDPGETTDIKQNFTLVNQGASNIPVSVSVSIQPMFTASQPAKEMGLVAQANATVA